MNVLLPVNNGGLLYCTVHFQRLDLPHAMCRSERQIGLLFGALRLRAASAAVPRGNSKGVACYSNGKLLTRRSVSVAVVGPLRP